MDARSTLTTEARNVLALARKDRRAATEALALLSLPAQVAVVCEAPVRDRSLLLELSPNPESLIPLLPEAEFCFTLKAVGLTDASWMIAYASRSQIVAGVDLDAWSGLLPDLDAFEPWIATLAASGEPALLRGTQSLDAEMLVRYLRDRITVYLDPRDDDWQAPPGAQTLDGQFYFAARRENDDIAHIVRLFDVIFREDYWLYYRLMQGAIWELDTDLDEWALRWRTGRLQDMGFPPWDEAMQIFGYLRPDARTEIPEIHDPLDMDAWALPVWMPGLPAAHDSRHLVFRALADLDGDERRGFFYSFVGVANAVAVAEKMPLGDAETLPQALERTATVASAAIEFLADQNGLSAVEILRRVDIKRLFRVGINLSPHPVDD